MAIASLSQVLELAKVVFGESDRGRWLNDSSTFNKDQWTFPTKIRRMARQQLVPNKAGLSGAVSTQKEVYTPEDEFL